VARKTDSSDEKLDPSLIHKKKARRRLVGAVAFLAAVGVSLPFLLDSEPKPSSRDVQIRVPAREPMNAGGTEPVAPQAKAGNSSPPVVPVVPLEPTTGDAAKDFPTPSRIETKPAEPKRDESKKDELKKDESKRDDSKKDGSKKDESKKDGAKKDTAKKDPALKDMATKDTATKVATPEPKKPEAKKPDPKKDEPKKDEPKKDEAKAYRVQIGAFSSEDSAMEQLGKASKLGLKAYTEKIATNNGTKTRVRVGPFANREQAEQALAKLKLNGVEAALVAP
jgi:DedD protein